MTTEPIQLDPYEQAARNMRAIREGAYSDEEFDVFETDAAAFRAGADASAQRAGYEDAAEYLTASSMLLARDAGFSVVRLSDVTPEAPGALLIGQLDPAGHTILFGTGDTGKGVIASHWIVELVRAGHRVMVLDYEAHPDEWARRVDALGDERIRSAVLHVTPPWRGSLWDHADQLRDLARSFRATFVVVDSIVTACKTDPLSAETPGMYAGALTSLGIPALSIAHVNRADDARYPFGSVFWHNLARFTWHVARRSSEGHVVLLTNRKHNNYPYQGKHELTIEWWDNLPREVRSKRFAQALADRIAEALADGPLAVQDVVDQLNAEVDDASERVKADSVRAALRRGMKNLPKRFTLSGTGDDPLWSLA